MLRIGMVVVIALGCGGGAKTAPPPTKRPEPPPQVAQKPPAPPECKSATPPAAEAFCTRMLALKTAKCALFADAEVTAATCVDEAKSALAGNVQLRAAGRCLVNHDSCEEITGCIKAIDASELHEAAELRACTDPADERPVGISHCDYEKRNGVGVTKFSQAKSTKELPIEMCGIRPANTWLVSLSCDDGSRPLKSNADAERSRIGNVGPGGRCGSIVDHYRVACGDKAYDIFTDGYVCPRE